MIDEPVSFFTRLRDFTTDALRYWEIRRLFYNALLALIFLGHLVATWPAAKNEVTFNGFLGMIVLAVLANVAYSAVYVVDIFVQLSGFRDSRRIWRLAILIVGFTFAAILAHFMSQTIAAGAGGS